MLCGADLSKKQYEAAETGGTILGVSYPVMTTLSDLEAIGAAEAESEDALAEAGNYAYYIYDAADYESDDEEEEDDTETAGPGGSMGGSSTVYDDYDYSYYKVLTVTDGEASFSAAVYVNGATELTDADVSLSDSSQYGDYQLEVSADTDGTVFGVIITAVDEEGNETDYGLRALENIWRSGSQLSWSVGYSTTEKHGNTLSCEHYASMEGSTITTITYITSAGLYTISDLELEVTGAGESSDSDSDSGIPDGDITEDGTDDETEDGEGTDDSTDDDGTVTPPSDDTESSDSESSEDTSDTEDIEDIEGSGSDDTSGDVSTGDASDMEDTAESESDGTGTGDVSDTDTAGSDEASGEAGTGDTSGSEEAADADSTDTDDDADLSDDDAESSDTSDDEDNSSSDDAAEVGDSSNMIFWVVLAVFALVSLAGASIKRKFS